MPKIDVTSVPERTGSGYPAPFHEKCVERMRKRLGDAGGLSQFGVNLLTLAPGAWSSQRHWHSHEDELIYVVAGEVVLVTNGGEEVLTAGDCAGFKAGDPDGHSFQNRSNADVVLLEIGTRNKQDAARYSDIDMITIPGRPGYAHRDGTPYPLRQRAI